MAKKLNTEDFIRKARAVHGDKYDYSKVEYVDTHTKVVIICPIHGEFKQVPNYHLCGNGCQKCSVRNIKYSQEEIINKAKEVHGNKYNYSKVNYITSKTKITIICPIHGEFKIQPTNHINSKQGCPKCYDDKRTNVNLRNTEFFISKAKAVHGDKYDYSKSVYVGANKPIIIICPEHGEFQQKASCHYNLKHGCPKCGGVGLINTEYFILKSNILY